MSLVNVASLQRAAETYQKDMILLPYALLIPTLRELKISMLEVDNKDIVVVKNRRGGLARPYVLGGTNATVAEEISRMRERALTTEFAYCSIKDNILNYKEKRVLFDASKDKINNQTKKHPLEQDIISDQVIIVGEDIIDALFHSSRNASDLTPMGMCDGIYTILDDLVVAGELSLAKGNLVNAGSLAAPAAANDIVAYLSLRNWLRNVDPKMKNKALVLYITPTTLLNVKDALENKKSGFKDITFEQVLAYLRDDCQLPNLQIVSHYALGTGTRLTLTEPGNFDLGMNTFSDAGFVQVRNPWEDPNFVQFWMQWQIGARVKNTHKRGLMMSDGTTVSNELSGDYQITDSGVTVGI